MQSRTPSVALQPASPTKKPDSTNFKATIETRVDLRDHADVISEADYAALKSLFPDEMVPMWGIQRGTNGMNPKHFEALKPGDVVLFAGGSRIYMSGTVAYTWVNTDLARRLWGPAEGPTWELMYAIMNPVGKRTPMAEFRSWAGWKNPKRDVRGFQILVARDEKGKVDKEETERITRNVIERLNLSIPEIPDLKPSKRRTTGASSFEGDLDKAITSYARIEQPKLRKMLIPEEGRDCVLCGRELPAEFLVAAHIKKRSLCTDEERADLPTIAMPNCKFGCDELFERGYISVAPGGRIEVSYRVDEFPTIAAYVSDHLADRTVDYWSAANELYFAWHREIVFRQELRPQA